MTAEPRWKIDLPDLLRQIERLIEREACGQIPEFACRSRRSPGAAPWAPARRRASPTRGRTCPCRWRRADAHGAHLDRAAHVRQGIRPAAFLGSAHGIEINRGRTGHLAGIENRDTRIDDADRQLLGALELEVGVDLAVRDDRAQRLRRGVRQRRRARASPRASSRGCRRRASSASAAAPAARPRRMHRWPSSRPVGEA